MRHAGTQDHHVALFNKGARVPLELARHLALFSPLPKILGQSIFAALFGNFRLAAQMGRQPGQGHAGSLAA